MRIYKNPSFYEYTTYDVMVHEEDQAWAAYRHSDARAPWPFNRLCNLMRRIWRNNEESSS